MKLTDKECNQTLYYKYVIILLIYVMVILYITKGFKGNQKAMMREMETIKRVK